MADSVRHSVNVGRRAAGAFSLFVEEFQTWWPREYTWSQDVLEAIGIEPGIDGMCYERGPHGFRCDWGRVLVWEPPRRLEFTWQISPRREPVPNPTLASVVGVSFDERSDGSTQVSLEHWGFERHGSGSAEYQAAMGSAHGWPYILQCFAAAAT
jgi:uncharacterized protein YndB with AHSA1/START domain